jgi:hypothetical protein
VRAINLFALECSLKIKWAKGRVYIRWRVSNIIPRYFSLSLINYDTFKSTVMSVLNISEYGRTITHISA